VQRDRVEAQLSAARSAGANIRFGGERVGGRGYFLSPAVLTDVEDSMDVMAAETFGPVAPISRVESLDEAIARANSTPYGLGACVYTRRCITCCARWRISRRGRFGSTTR
jgi:acyl-CoA reductase-like NAD-dependent aldehyde dehydrogenase